MGTTQQTGLIPMVRFWLFGQSDPIDRHIRNLSRRGRRRAAIAHACAFALVALFSLQSLVALGSDALNSAVRSWTVGHSPNIPATISAALVVFLVLCMDVGMLKNAAELRDLQSRRAGRGEKAPRLLIMVTIALVEAGTYVYMECKFNPPADVMAWTLIIVRAALMPVLSIDLSLARALPLGPKGMSYETELVSGHNLMRDLLTEANDQTAPLTQKMKLYSAAANMDADDQERLEHMIEVVMQHPELPPIQGGGATPSSSHDVQTEEHPKEGGPAATHDHEHEGAIRATGSGPKHTNMSSSKLRKRRAASMPSMEANWQSDGGRSNVRTLPFGTGTSQTGQSARANAGRSLADTEELRKRRELAAERIMSGQPDVGPRGLARQIEQETGAPCSESTAQEIIKMIRARSA